MSVRIRAASVGLLVATLLLGLGGRGAVSQVHAEDPTPTPVTTGNIPLLAVSGELCFLLTAAKDALAGPSCNAFDLDPATLRTVAELNGNNGGPLQPEDFAGVDVDGNMMHQMDDWTNPAGSGSGTLWIMAWVASDAPVEFKTNLGVFVPPNTPEPGVPHPTTDDPGQVYHCDNLHGSVVGPEDADCDGDPGTVGDHVVVARLRSRFGSDIADLGPGTVTVRQGSSDIGTIHFTVVGEPRSLKFTTLESTIQTGTTDPATQCKLPGDAAGFLEANSNPRKAIVLAIAMDIDGNPVTGAIVNWSTSDADLGIMATGLTPTLDLGAFGFGAPNILCGTDETGTVTVEADLTKDVNLGSTHVPNADPNATPAIKKVDFAVVGVPASMTLAAAPASIPCDGVATSSVTATVIDADGSPVTTGNVVHFDVQVLGTANPINPTTNGEGVATSVITPLAVDATGVPVIVTAGDVTQSILVSCAGAAPPPPAGQPGGGGAPSGGGAGVISPPNTGSGGVSASAPAGVPAWTYVLFALGALGLTATSVMWTMRTNRQ